LREELRLSEVEIPPGDSSDQITIAWAFQLAHSDGLPVGFTLAWQPCNPEAKSFQ
jgi:hypothetical protein